MIYGLGCEAFQGCCTGRHTPKILQRLARDEGFVVGVRFPDSYQKWGVQNPTPHR